MSWVTKHCDKSYFRNRKKYPNCNSEIPQRAVPDSCLIYKDSCGCTQTHWWLHKNVSYILETVPPAAFIGSLCVCRCLLTLKSWWRVCIFHFQYKPFDSYCGLCFSQKERKDMSNFVEMCAKHHKGEEWRRVQRSFFHRWTSVKESDMTGRFVTKLHSHSLPPPPPLLLTFPPPQIGNKSDK